MSELEELRAAAARVRELHQAREDGWCSACAETNDQTGEFQDFPCPTIAALDGAPEPEWEYGAKVYNSGRVVRIEDSPEKVQLGRSATSYANPQWVDDVLVRRRKAGPWLPVEGESK